MVEGRRAQQQARNREHIRIAAREEFAHVGYRHAKIDQIAKRAHLTRGAIYSNFPSKRALGLTIAAELCHPQHANPQPQTMQPQITERHDAVASLAQAWLARLPAGGSDAPEQLEHLASDLYAEVREDHELRDAFAELLKLDAVLLAYALEHLATSQPSVRQVRAASALLSVLHASGQLSATAPGFTDPFDVVTTCTALAATDFQDQWSPPDESIVPPVHPVDRAWAPPTGNLDLVSHTPVERQNDGIVAVLGLRHASAVEEVIRGGPAGLDVTVVLVTDDPGERAPLARLALTELTACLRLSVPADALAGIRLVIDHDGDIARAAGLRSVNDDTHLALRVNDGRITAQADGVAACHAIATAQHKQHKDQRRAAN